MVSSVAVVAAGAGVDVAANPRVLPPCVVQHSVRIDSSRAAETDDPFGGIVLPPDVAGAVPKRRLQFRAGRYCARQAIATLEPGRHIGPLARSGSGAAEWPAGITGSITHTDDFASAAVASLDDVGGIGIDSERIMSSEQARQVSLLVAWPSEVVHAREAGLDRLAALTLVFSIKEATFKCLYGTVGRRFGFHDVRVIGVDGTERTFHLRLVTRLCAEYAAGTIVTGRFDFDTHGIHTGMVIPADRKRAPRQQG